MNISLWVGLAAAVMILVERYRPGRAWPVKALWWTRALTVNGIQVAIVVAVGLWCDPWLAAVRPWSAAFLGPFWGALAGYVAITFVYYWWHRIRHRSDVLWRWFHQFHHSPERIEIVTSFYKHPLEMAVNGLLSSIIVFPLLGLAPAVAGTALLLTGLAELFYHWNVATPYWLGFFIQRPESHCVHHERGRHHYNYSDLPLWDMLFGTFKNPRQSRFECGFGEDRELRIPDLLKARDVVRGGAV